MEGDVFIFKWMRPKERLKNQKVIPDGAWGGVERDGLWEAQAQRAEAMGVGLAWQQQRKLPS